MGDLTVTKSIVGLLKALVTSSAIALAFGCSGIDAGVDYPGNLPDFGDKVRTPENESDPSIGFSRFKIAPETCQGIDTHAIATPLTQEDLTRFLEKQGAKFTVKKARSNLYWYEFPTGEEGSKSFVRLRLAVLNDPAYAAYDLHTSVLQHGPGWWGVRRANLALLAPKASLRTAMGFAMKYKLVCWGMFTYAGNDDAYVVPGPYAEL